MADVERFEKKPLSLPVAQRRMRTLLKGSVKLSPLAERQKVRSGWLDTQVARLIETGVVEDAKQTDDGALYYVKSTALTPKDGPQKARVRFDGRTLVIWAIA